MANLSRIDQPSKLKLYTSTAKVSRYVASSAFSGALVWLAVAQSGLAGLVPGGITPWILAAGTSALLALALAPFVVLDPKNLRDRLRRSAIAMAIGHTIVSIFLGALFLANPINLFFGTIASALIGAAAGALSGLISWKLGEGKQ